MARDGPAQALSATEAGDSDEPQAVQEDAEARARARREWYAEVAALQSRRARFEEMRLEAAGKLAVVEGRMQAARAEAAAAAAAAEDGGSGRA